MEHWEREERGIRERRDNIPFQPRWGYGIHLTPWSVEIEGAVKEVEKAFFFQVFGGIAHRRVNRPVCFAEFKPRAKTRKSRISYATKIQGKEERYPSQMW